MERQAGLPPGRARPAPACPLQELLEFTLVHQAQLAGDGELFGDEDGLLGPAADEGEAAGGEAAGAADEAGAGGEAGPAAVPA